MTDPMARLRAADPAAGDRQADDRAEHDLQVLLAEAPAPARVLPPAPPRRRTASLLVTAAVAVVVIATTAAVLGIVHPRPDVGGTPTTPVSIAPTLGTASCHPAQVLPFECGTYRSVYGAKSITGDEGGPAKDPVSLSVGLVHGVLTLTASGRCLSAAIPVTAIFAAEATAPRLKSSNTFTVNPIGKVRFGQGGCHGRGADTKSWAYTWLQHPHEVEAGSGLTVDSSTAMVTFEFEGAAPIGAKQTPRNESTCVPAHVAPFSCSTFFSTGGTGRLAFLGTNRFQLTFAHLNGELTAGLYGRCNSLGRVLEPDGNTVVAVGGSSTAMGCMGPAGTQDDAVMDFFSGVLTDRIDGARITFTSGSSSATFSSDIGACLPSAATSPFCGSSTATGGSGAVAFLGSGSYRITFGQSGKQFTATVQALCGATTYAVAVDGSVLHLRRISATGRSCPATADAHDTALATFLTAPLTYRSDGDTLTLDSAASGPFSSATFTRDR